MGKLACKVVNLWVHAISKRGVVACSKTCGNGW